MVLGLGVEEGKNESRQKSNISPPLMLIYRCLRKVKALAL